MSPDFWGFIVSRIREVSNQWPPWLLTPILMIKKWQNPQSILNWLPSFHVIVSVLLLAFASPTFHWPFSFILLRVHDSPPVHELQLSLDRQENSVVWVNCTTSNRETAANRSIVYELIAKLSTVFTRTSKSFAAHEKVEQWAGESLEKLTSEKWKASTWSARKLRNVERWKRFFCAF